MLKKILYVISGFVVCYLYAINFADSSNIKENPILSSLYVSLIVGYLLHFNKKNDERTLLRISSLSFGMYIFLIEVLKETVGFSLVAFVTSTALMFVVMKVFLLIVNFISKKNRKKVIMKKEYHPLESFHFPKPITPEVMAEAYRLGMIRKEDLIDGKTYFGRSRNASEAVWHKDKNRFTYIRTKFGASFKEDINHPEDDNEFDLFVPIRLIEP